MNDICRSERRARWLLALVVLIWGASWPVIKIGVTTVPPIWFACLRYGAATVCLFVVLALRSELAWPAPSDWKLILVSGVLQMAAYSALTGMALTRLAPGRASVLAYSTPVWVVPLSIWWLHEEVPWRGRVGVVIGVAGVAAIVSPGLQPGLRDQLVPYLLLMGAAAVWAVSIVFVRGHPFQSSALVLAPWQTLVAALLLVPFALTLNGRFPEVDFRGIASLAYVGPMATALAYWAVVEAGRYLRPAVVSVALLGVPILGLLISALTLHETVTASLGFGIVLIGASVLLTTMVGQTAVSDASLRREVQQVDRFRRGRRA